MTDHSPEPWKIEPCGEGGYRVTDANEETVELPVYFGRHSGGAWSRIVACVNALTGVPTSVLESGAISKLLISLMTAPTKVLCSKTTDAPLTEVLERFYAVRIAASPNDAKTIRNSPDEGILKMGDPTLEALAEVGMSTTFTCSACDAIHEVSGYTFDLPDGWTRDDVKLLRCPACQATEKEAHEPT
jgi:hypothetical protein